MKHLVGAALLIFTFNISAEEISPMDLARGPISSGGGMGVVCYDSSGKNIESVELLDLWEARKLYDRSIESSELSVKELVLEQLHNLKNAIDSEGLLIGHGNGDPDSIGSDGLPQKKWTV